MKDFLEGVGGQELQVSDHMTLSYICSRQHMGQDKAGLCSEIETVAVEIDCKVH